MINIGNFVLGQEKPFIIAEIGSNWKTQEDCLTSVGIARSCGADAVKFQMFNFKGMYGLSKKSMPTFYDPKAELPIEFLNPINEACNSYGIKLMISSFDEDLLCECDRFVECHKVASSKITNRKYLERVGSFGKPIFLSCGAANEADISLALTCLSGCSVILNYCVAGYPATEIDLFTIGELKKIKPEVGFSDHTKDFTYIPRAAVKLHGAIALEKHLSCIPSVSMDSGHSLTPSQFKTMVDYINGTKQTHIGPTAQEKDMILRHRDRWIATALIKAGDILSEGDNIGCHRSITAESDIISPFRDISGLPAKRAIQAGHAVGGLDI